MPYVSTAQQGWAHTAEGMKALGGAAKVHEWDEATKAQPGGFKSLPSHVGKSVKKGEPARKTRRWGQLG